MDCDTVKQHIPDYLKGSLDNGTRVEFERHIAGCQACRTELGEIERIWFSLGTLKEEEPSPDLARRFYATLDAYSSVMDSSQKKSSAIERFDSFLGSILPKRPVYQAAAAIVIIAMSVFITNEAGNRKQTEIEVASLKTEMAHMRELLTISMLTQSSAVDRLQALTMSGSIDKPDVTLIDALISTLNTDTNVNVRLAAVDALGRFSDNEQVREALIESLKRQRSPLVQISLVNLLVTLKEERVRPVLEAMIDNQNNAEPVKKTAKKGLEQMI